MFIETVSQHKISRKRSEMFVVICGNGEKTNFEQINDKKTILKPLRGRYALRTYCKMNLCESIFSVQLL